jgi:uncharacterized protein RhaS with RHS repeats
MKWFQKVLLVAASAFFLTAQANAIMYFARPYDPNLQRWLTRDPIGEQGGNNLFEFVGNDAVNYVDPLGYANITLNVNWGQGLRTPADRHRLQQNMDQLRNEISKCCQQYTIACGVTVSAQQGGNDGVPVNMVDQSQILSGNPNFIAHGSAEGPVNWRINYPNQYSTVLSHELGHVGGYTDPKNTKDPVHSPNSDNLMYPINNGATGVDRCYCQSISKLAK